jgi:hypothetical protein
MEEQMNRSWRPSVALAAAAAVSLGLFGTAPAQQPPAEQGPAPEGQATATQQERPGSQLPVLYVTSVEVVQTATEPHLDIVRAQGLVASKGWGGPFLAPVFVGKPLDGILDLQFIASTPDQSQAADGFVPISATFELAPGNPFKGVRVRAAENAIEVDKMPGSKSVDIKVNDCRDCIGKKFVEHGHSGPGTIGRDDLPRGEAMVRWIPPGRGIRGITHDPNRLNLILGPDNTIVSAFWE